MFTDISVIGALGDSLTCSTGAMASNFMELSMENRGVAWSIGGEQQISFNCVNYDPVLSYNLGNCFQRSMELEKCNHLA